MQRKLAELLNVIFGFRKFILMMLLFVLALVFRVQNLISGDNMVDLLKATTIAFFGANGVEHIMTVVKDTLAARNGQSVTPSVPPGDNIIPSDEQDPPETKEAT